MPSFVSPSRFIATLGSATLAVSLAACAPDFDQSDADIHIEELIADSHPSLAELPSVRSLVVRDDAAVAFVAGELGRNLDRVVDVFNLGHADLALESDSVLERGWSQVRYSQSVGGIPVVGGDVRVTFNADGDAVSAQGVAWDEAPIETQPVIAAIDSVAIAKDSSPGALESTIDSLVFVARPNAAPALAWRTEVKGHFDGLPLHDVVFVDAIDGTIAARHPQVHSARNRMTYTANNTGGNNGQPQTQLVRTEGSGLSGDTDIDTLHDADGQTYDCLNGLFGRDSFDGSGATFTSIAHVGANYQNAYYVNGTLNYGDAFAVTDVATHEAGHGLTESTAGLIYQNDSGALNEAASDILAAVCQVYDIDPTLQTSSINPAVTWTVGENLSPGLQRYMFDPTTDNYSRDHLSTKLTGPGDNGGVHGNSGIANLQFVLMTQGGTHPRRPGEQEVVAIGMTDASKILYRSLTTYLSPNATFAEARAAGEMAATQEFGADSSQYFTVQEAWYAVGVGGPPQTRPEPQDPQGPNDPDDGNGGGDGGGGGGGNGGGDGGGTGSDVGGNLAGGCSTSGGGSGSLALLLVLGAFGFIRRRRSNR